MAKFPIYNPAVEEALSPPIGGMSNSITIMSEVLNLGTTAVENEAMSELFIADDDRYRIYSVELNKRGWLETPAPIIKKNGVVISASTDGFVIHYLGGCIEFLNDNTRPISGDIITASFTYVNGTSATINGINTSVSALTSKTANYRGSFDTLAQLKSGVVNPLQYDYAYVFGTVSDIYFYNSSISDWLSVTANDVADLEAQITALQNGKENAIGTKNTAFNKNFGTGNEEVMRGDFAYSKNDTDTKLATKEPTINDKGTAFNKDFGTVANTVMQGDYAYSKATTDGKYEPTIATKNSAFNKNFGTDEDTVMEGNYAYSKEVVDEKVENSSGIYTPYSSEYITSQESSLGIIDSMVVEGKTYQNLARLDLDASELFTELYSGISLSNNFLSIVTDDSMYKLAYYTYNKAMYKPSTQYTVVLNVTENALTYQLELNNGNEASTIFSNTEYVTAGSVGVQKFLFTTKDDLADASIILRMLTSQANTGSITYSFMILEGDYTSTDLPSTITGIESVSGDVTFKSVGKNIANMEETVYLNSTNSAYSHGSVTLIADINRLVEIPARLKAGTTYYVSLESDFDGTIGMWNGCSEYYGTNGAFAPSMDIDHVVVYIANTETENVTFTNFQIEESSTATDYEPYTESSITVEDLNLRSLPDGTKDYVSWEDGGWWECVGKKIVTTDMINAISTIYTDNSDEYKKTYVNIPDSYLVNTAYLNASPDKTRCTKHRMEYHGLNLVNTSYTYVSVLGGSLRYNVDMNITDLDTVKQMLLDVGEFVVYYPLKTPIFHPLPLETLKSLSGTTHVFSEGSNVEPNISCRILENAPEVISVTQEAIMKVEEKLQAENDNQIDKSDIVDNLSTDDATKVLSAKQGKALNDAKAPNSHASSGTTYGVASTTNYGHVKYGNAEGTACQGNDSRLSNSRTPNSHASTATTYGKATSSSYGHTKLSDSYSSTSDANGGISATPKAVKFAYDLATAANNNANNRIAKTQFSLSGTTLTITL